MLKFRPVDLEKDLDKVIEFRKDSFVVSFGDEAGFNEEDYLLWLKETIAEFPEGILMVEEHGEPIGQLEMAIREFGGGRIGYVHLYYLVAKSRRKGKGRQLHDRAISFFSDQNVEEFHLRVSTTNTSAISFYQKLGMEEVGHEIDGRVMRMKWQL